MATSLASAMATSSPLPIIGPPRFFVIARAPLARFPNKSKTAIFTPVRPAVHDATTGEFLAAIPLPAGVRSSWQVLAAAPDNRTFVLSGWTGPDSPLRFFRVHLAEDGSPSDPIPVPGLESDALGAGYILALSPDATRLAYAASIPGGAKISVVDLATGQRRDWSTRVSVVTGLAWAPDGQRIALVVGGWGIGVLDLGLKGSDLLAATRLVKPSNDLPFLESVAYTPDGSALIYSAGHAIMRIPVDGRGKSQVLARLTLRFSLDGTGQYLLYVHRWRGFRVDLANGSTTPMPIKTDEHPGEGDSPNAAW
ncbi:hypothetical protein OHB01_38800 [Microbispora hainanensis]|uniref:TolB family protein n=1 Tax=Microbispora TaxID=2005 RepID=UPI00115B3890|nr:MULTISPECIES: hypothetical protein [Microbispora]NJP23563.1 hypothetical protein [Microbispora sp. CL1-1]TQS15792.1 hypothetical protein FLW53_04965 [Microbispora sp. SCL1-1]